MDIVLYLINLIHIITIAFILIVPFTNSMLLLLIYFITIPFIMLHWIVNDDTCALTTIEHYLRIKINGGYVPKEHCISYKLFSPIYNFTKGKSSLPIWVISILLYFIVYSKVPVRQAFDCIRNIVIQ